MKIDALLKDKLISFYERGYLVKDVAKEYNVPKHRVEYWNKILKINVRDYKRKYNIHVFDVIDTEEKAYWLGFLYADGNVYVRPKGGGEVTLALHIKDLHHIEKFKSFMGDKRPNAIKHRLVSSGTKPGEKSECYRYRITSNYLANSLIKLGCVQNKSLILTFPDIKIFKDPNLVYDFIRGSVDGDGCLHVDKRYAGGTYPIIDLVGTKSFLEGVKMYCQEFGPIHEKTKTGISRIEAYGENARAIANKLYGHATIYLDRKFEKFATLFKYKDSETSGNIGEVCDDNTEISGEIAKGSSTS